jgi:hypothetical protein
LCAGGVLAQESVEFTDLVERAATVSAIDSEQRLVTLRGPEGGELTLEAGPEVRNFAQLEVGDVVRLSYEQYYSATRISVEEAPETFADGAAMVARAAEGERPGVAVGAIETMVVLIESIGPDGRSATFITPDGALHSIFVIREESREFARSLEAGDLVELTFADAIALVVEPLDD